VVIVWALDFNIRRFVFLEPGDSEDDRVGSEGGDVEGENL